MGSSVTLLATGDLMLKRAVQRHENNERVYEVLRRADLTFANLEMPFTEGGERADKLVCLKADPGLVGELKSMGVDVVTVANNHALDYGITGLLRSLEVLREAGVPAVGGGRNLEESLLAHFAEKGGTRIAFLGVASTLPSGSAAGPERPGIAPIRVFTKYVTDPVSIDENPGIAPYVETTALEPDVELVLEQVRKAREQADAVVVGIHWGVPHGWTAQYQGALAEYQRPLGHRLIDAGATLVLGHHPHVIHGVEAYGGGLIVYSLGNFLFHTLAEGQPALGRPYPPYSWRSLRSPINHQTYVLRATLQAGKLAGAELILLQIDERGEPCPADRETAEEIAGRTRAYSEEVGLGEGISDLTLTEQDGFHVLRLELAQ